MMLTRHALLAPLLALAAIGLPVPAAGQDDEHGARVLHSPWLALRIEQDGVAVPLRHTDTLETSVSLARRPFTLVLPVRGPDDDYRLAAWTNASILSAAMAQPSSTKPAAADEEEEPPFFSPYRCMADTAAGSGTLMLNFEGHHCLTGLRLGPEPDRHLFHVSQIMQPGSAEQQIERVTGPLFLVAFFDEEGNGQPDHGEYELLVLHFEPTRR